MYPAPIRYLRPSGQQEVLDVLAELGSDARILAGGASLIPQLKYRQVEPAPSVVVDVSGVPELSGTDRVNGDVVVGAMTRHVEAEADDVLTRAVPGVRDVAGAIGDQQVRNMGTVGGGLVAVEPTGDWGPFLTAIGGRVRVRSARGEREVAAADLFEAPLRSTIRPDELLTHVVFPAWPGRSGSAHAKLLVRAVTALGSCSVAVTVDDDGRIERIGVGVGGLTPVPVTVPDVAPVLVGQHVTTESVAAAKTALAAALPTHTDTKTSAAHRRDVAGSLFERALHSALARATGDSPAPTRGGRS